MAVSPVQNTTPANMPEHLRGMDFHTMMMALVFERAETLNSVIEGQMADMAAKNEEIKKLNNALNEVRAAAPEKDEEGNNFTAPLSPEAVATLEKYGIDFMQKETKEETVMPGWTPPAGATIISDERVGAGLSTDLRRVKYETGSMELKKDGDYERMVENIKTQIDSLSQDSQLDMIKLQGLIQKHNQTIEMGSNEIAKYGQTAGTVISNMAR